jgi:hypothetical protein
MILEKKCYSYLTRFDQTFVHEVLVVLLERPAELVVQFLDARRGLVRDEVVARVRQRVYRRSRAFKLILNINNYFENQSPI